MTTQFRDLPGQDDFPVKLPDGLLDWTRRAEEEHDWSKDDQEYVPEFQFDRWSVGHGRYGVVFPPVGFLEISEWIGGDMGNGDHYGLYWPIGREQRDPLIARSSHDCGTIIPIASNLACAARLDKGVRAPAEQLAGLPTYRFPKENPDTIWSADGLAERLEIDPASPYLLVANADVALHAGDASRAESLYLLAVEALPEYTAAHLGLAEMHRRAGATREECRWTLEALRSPLSLRGESFWADDLLPPDRVDRRDYRARSLARLKELEPGDVGDLAGAPLYQARGKLIGTFGRLKNRDYPVYDRLIDRYIELGQPIEAVKLAMLYGESMDREHVGFYLRSKKDTGYQTSQKRDELARRHGYSESTQRARLLKAFRAAGLDARAEMLLRSISGDDGS